MSGSKVYELKCGDRTLIKLESEEPIEPGEAFIRITESLKELLDRKESETENVED